MIRLDNVIKAYKGTTVALRDVSVDIQKGEFVFMVGPSGSGKSTFLRLVTKEERADEGQVWVAGKEVGSLSAWKVPYLRRNIGCVYQDFRLLPTKSVYDNVAFALEVIGRPRHVVKTQVPQILELVGLGKKLSNLPHELSGGEQQRVAIARAFVNRPLILLADEPTGNLDPRASCACSTGSTGPAPRSSWPPTTTGSSTPCAVGSSSWTGARSSGTRPAACTGWGPEWPCPPATCSARPAATCDATWS
jgi:cell division transport system ATP-binding protein